MAIAPDAFGALLRNAMIPTDEEVARAFDTALPWREVFDAFRNGSAMIPGAMGSAPTRPEILLRILKKTAATGVRHDLRIFIDGRRLPLPKMMELAASPKRDDTLNSWMSRVIGPSEFCVIQLNLEAVDESLARAAARYVAPVVRPGGSLTGLTVGTFSGHYRQSPIGIHTDANLEGIFQFQLGPNSKEVRYWPAANGPGARAHGHKSGAAPRELVGVPGDGFWINGQDSHVGAAPKPAVSLTVGIQRETPWNLIQRTARQLNWHRPSPLTRWADQDFANSLDWPNIWSGMAMEDVVEDVIEIRKASLASNGGLEAPPSPRDGGVPEDGLWRLSDPDLFPLRVINIRGKTVVAARGRVRPFDRTTPLMDALEILARGDVLTVEEFRTQARERETEAEFLMAMRWLCSTRAVDLIANP